jgi:hypothetical protein
MLEADTIKVEVADYAGRIARAEIASKWIGQLESPKGELYGADWGSVNQQRILTSIRFTLPGARSVAFADEAFSDLINAHVLIEPTVLNLRVDTLTLGFNCGSGERFVMVNFEWNRKTGILGRSIGKLAEEGAWKAKWRLSKGKWTRLVKNRFED